MRFQASLLDSEVWDTGEVINDEVYRRKQRNKMISMLSPFDYSILNRIDPPINPSICHSDLHATILEYNFTFERQYQFYFQWYVDY